MTLNIGETETEYLAETSLPPVMVRFLLYGLHDEIPPTNFGYAGKSSSSDHTTKNAVAPQAAKRGKVEALVKIFEALAKKDQTSTSQDGKGPVVIEAHCADVLQRNLLEQSQKEPHILSWKRLLCLQEKETLSFLSFIILT